MHLCLACYRGLVAAGRSSPEGSTFNAAAPHELAAEGALQVHEPAEAEESFGVLVAIEGAEHARKVVGGGDLGTESTTERFALGAPAEVVVAAGACRLGDE